PGRGVVHRHVDAALHGGAGIHVDRGVETIARVRAAGQAHDRVFAGRGVPGDGDVVAIGGDRGAVERARGHLPAVGVDDDGLAPRLRAAADGHDVADFVFRAIAIHEQRAARGGGDV